MSSDRRSTAGAAAPESHCNLFASTVRGLERLAAAELTERGHRVVSIRKRQIQLTSPAPLSLDRPRTIDDLLIQVAATEDPGATKAGLERLRTLLLATDLAPVRDHFRSGATTISVSASITGQRNYNRYDLEAIIGTVLAERLGVRYASRAGGLRPPPGATEWRAVLSADGFLLGLRGPRPPLHRRAWKTATIPGTLHPPVAAAMARLAGIAPGMCVLDPCCGAGTIPAEAHELEPKANVVGADLDPAALAAARRNTRHLPRIGLHRSDAARLPFSENAVDRIVTNPAWGRQVAARRPFTALLAEWRRVITDQGRLVCLVPPELLPHFDSGTSGWKVLETRPLSLAGRHPTLVVAAP
jgi:23S rRNA G2445 N2-methylase RlmL